MTRRVGTLITGASAAVVLIGLVAGVPVALAVAVGWPLPRAAPTWDAISRALTGGTVTDATWLKALACVVWAAWAQLTVAVALEVISSGRGRVTPKIPGVASATQLLAGRLVATVAVLIFSLSTQPAARALPPLPVASAAQPAFDQATLTATATTPHPAAKPATEKTTKTWTVRRRDTLWSIAETTLGDGGRYVEIFELNRDVTQPDGKTLTRADLILPGWVLALPGDATTPPAPPALYQVKPGDTLWDIAHHQLGDGQRSRELFTRNAGRPQPDGQTLTNPGLIRPGWQLELPTASPAPHKLPAGPPPASPNRPPATITSPAPTIATPPPYVAAPPAVRRSTPPPTSMAPATSAPSAISSAPDHDLSQRVHDSQSDASPTAIEVAIGGVAIAGLIAVLDRLRRVQQRRRRSGRRIAMPAADDARAEMVLRQTARTGTSDDVNRALRTLAAAGDALPEVEIRSVRAGPAGVTIQAGAISDLPPGFQSTPEGWLLVPDHDEQIPGLPSPLPALVSLGRDGDDEVLIDLEAAGVLGVTGPAEPVTALLEAVALALATSPWTDDAEIIVVGVGVGGPLADLPWVRPIESLAEALTLAEARADEAADALATTRTTTPMAARAAGEIADAWEPTIVICADPPDADDRARLQRLAHKPHHCTAIVVAGDLPGAPWQARIQPDGQLHLAPLDITLQPPSLPADHAAAIDRLLTTAAAGDIDAPDPELFDPTPTGDEPGIPFSTEEPEGCDIEVALTPEIEVRVLGPVEVVDHQGEPIKFRRSKAAETVAYLALHPAGATKDTLEYALWPNGDNARGTWHQTISKTREALGTATDGTSHLPSAAGRRLYRLGEHVDSDYARFRRLVAEAHQLDGADVRLHLREALSLVRGEPFSGRGTMFAWRAGEAASIEAEIVDAAEILADDYLDRGDHRGAEWAARQGLLASPYDERLYRLLMRIADAAGNPAGVHSIITQLAALLELDIEPLDSLHPETVALYEQLTNRQRRASA